MRGRCQHRAWIEAAGCRLHTCMRPGWQEGTGSAACKHGLCVRRHHMCWLALHHAMHVLLHEGRAAACAHLVLSLSPGSTPAGGKVMILTAYWSPVFRSVANFTMAKPADMRAQGVWGGYCCVRCVQEPSAVTTQS